MIEFLYDSLRENVDIFFELIVLICITFWLVIH